jgi:hypothetical protein
VIALWLATCGVEAPRTLADDVVNPDDQIVQHFEQQFGPQLRQLHKSELHFMRIVCQPTKEQYGKIAAEGEPVVKATIRKLAESMAPQRRGGLAANQALDPRKALSEALAASVRTHLTPDQARQYQKELDLRATSMKRLAVRTLVAELDARLLLTAEQRGKLNKVLDKNWDNAWGQLQLLQYAAHYLPQLPEAEILPILSEKQKDVWRAIPKANVHFGFNLGFVQGIEIQEERWAEDVGDKPAEKK